MKIDKAIEVLEDIVHHVEPGDPPEEHDALKLGIEALERFKWRRESLAGWQVKSLPGETFD